MRTQISRITQSLIGFLQSLRISFIRIIEVEELRIVCIVLQFIINGIHGFDNLIDMIQIAVICDDIILIINSSIGNVEAITCMSLTIPLGIWIEIMIISSSICDTLGLKILGREYR